MSSTVHTSVAALFQSCTMQEILLHLTPTNLVAFVEAMKDEISWYLKTFGKRTCKLHILTDSK